MKRREGDRVMTFESIQFERIGFVYTDSKGVMSARVGMVEEIKLSKQGRRIVILSDETCDGNFRSFDFDRMAELSFA
jgi:hypothetical protein